MYLSHKHINIFFKLTGILLIINVILLIWGVILLGGIPNNAITNWTPRQWDLIRFLWQSTLIDSIIFLALAALCFIKRYFAFPLIALSLIFYLNNAIGNITEIFQLGFIYPVFNTQGIIILLLFILSIIGTIYWISKFKK